MEFDTLNNSVDVIHHSVKCIQMMQLEHSHLHASHPNWVPEKCAEEALGKVSPVAELSLAKVSNS
jgi:hypothetical protein